MVPPHLQLRHSDARYEHVRAGTSTAGWFCMCSAAGRAGVLFVFQCFFLVRCGWPGWLVVQHVIAQRTKRSPSASPSGMASAATWEAEQMEPRSLWGKTATAMFDLARPLC
jgi:hypothetical protein